MTNVYTTHRARTSHPTAAYALSCHSTVATRPGGDRVWSTHRPKANWTWVGSPRPFTRTGPSYRVHTMSSTAPGNAQGKHITMRARRRGQTIYFNTKRRVGTLRCHRHKCLLSRAALDADRLASLAQPRQRHALGLGNSTGTAVRRLPCQQRCTVHTQEGLDFAKRVSSRGAQPEIAFQRGKETDLPLGADQQTVVLSQGSDRKVPVAGRLRSTHGNRESITYLGLCAATAQGGLVRPVARPH